MCFAAGRKAFCQSSHCCTLIGTELTDNGLCGSSVGSTKDLGLNRYCVKLSMRQPGVSPGKLWWTKGQDPREGFNSLFRLDDCYQGCWLFP